MTTDRTLPPPQGPEYARCFGCGHIEPEHRPGTGPCLLCACVAYRSVPAIPEPSAAGLGVSATPSHTDLRQRIAAAVRRQAETGNVRYEALADAVLAVLPPPADRAAVLAEVLPDWEAVYEPGNVSDYLIGYANDQDAATGMAEAWMRSQAEVTGRLEWLSEERMATGRYDRWFELIERRDDGIDTGPGIVVRRRLADEAQEQEPPVHGESVAHLAGYQPDGHDTRDGEQAGGQTPCGPAPDQCDAEAGDPCANHEREQAHDEGEHCFCGPECEGVPTGRHYEVHDETRPVCSCGRFWPCDLAIQPADDARQDGVQQ